MRGETLAFSHVPGLRAPNGLRTQTAAIENDGLSFELESAQPRGFKADLLVMMPARRESHEQQVLSDNIRDVPSAEGILPGVLRAAWDRAEAGQKTRLRPLNTPDVNAQEVPSAFYHCVSSSGQTRPRYFDRERRDMQDHLGSNSQALRYISPRPEH